MTTITRYGTGDGYGNSNGNGNGYGYGYSGSYDNGNGNGYGWDNGNGTGVDDNNLINIFARRADDPLQALTTLSVTNNPIQDTP